MAKFPAKLGACIDLAYKMRDERLEKQKAYDAEIAEMKKEEEAINDYVINTFKKSEIEGARGDLCTASISRNIYPTNVQWDKVYAWVKKTGAFEIFERRISKSAFKERYEAGEKIPGVESYEKLTLSLTKTKK